MFVVVLIAVASDERDNLRHLAEIDKGIAAAVGSVSIYSLYTDYSERIDSCDYKWLVIAAYVLGAIVNLPKLPDATIHVLIVRFRQVWAPFVFSVVFLLLCVAFVIGALPERNYIGAFFVPVLMLFAMWAIKHVFLLLASGALLFLEALILVAGVPALLAACLKIFHESREIKVGLAEAVHGFKSD